MTLEQATVHKLIQSGVWETKHLIAQSGLSASRISEIKREYSEQVQKTLNPNMITELRSKSEESIRKQVESLEQDLEKIHSYIQGRSPGDKEWLTYHRQKIETLQALRSINGDDIMLKYAEKKALGSLSEEDRTQRRGESAVTYRPGKTRARKDIDV